MADRQTYTASLTNTSKGYLPECSCGWKGRETDRMSDDYACSNADDQLVAHKRTHTTTDQPEALDVLPSTVRGPDMKAGQP